MEINGGDDGEILDEIIRNKSNSQLESHCHVCLSRRSLCTRAKSNQFGVSVKNFVAAHAVAPAVLDNRHPGILPVRMDSRDRIIYPRPRERGRRRLLQRSTNLITSEGGFGTE